MKKFEIYKNIRKRAEILGLPISLFALMMISVVGSLFIIIFSFSFSVIITVFIFNTVLYMILIYTSKNPTLLNFRGVFPKTISNKKPCLANLHVVGMQESNLNYEEN